MSLPTTVGFDFRFFFLSLTMGCMRASVAGSADSNVAARYAASMAASIGDARVAASAELREPRRELLRELREPRWEEDLRDWLYGLDLRRSLRAPAT